MREESGYTPLMPDDSPAPQRTNWFRKLKETVFPEESPPPQSGYLTLIPLSDSRLQPPRTKSLLALVITLSLLSASAVFFLVPRGVSVGTIKVHSHSISFNRTQATYQIVLSTSIPVYNPNWLPVELSGTVNVSFYDQEAGHTFLNAATIPRRANPEAIKLRLDASSVPRDYLLTIYTQCFTFPHSLIFFLKASLQSKYLGTTWYLPKIDNYFMINCNETKHHHEDHSEHPISSAMGSVVQGEALSYQQPAGCC
mmetsp:Transcript_131/g.286  ORF Transcript_131/g.286 Transcript_131/m.286 type:complete len:254 (+) Transcript_131:98-859(+)